MDTIIPKGEHGKPTKPLSIRFRDDMLKRIDRVARETDNTRTDAIMHLLNWALTAYEKQRAGEREEEKAATG